MFRIIYMGTPAFAVPALEALIANAAPGKLLPEGYEIVTVITRPDKPSGRGKGLAFSPVKTAALAHAIPVWQPGTFRKAENSAALAEYHADLYVVAAFGQIFPQAVLDQPGYGILNIHASLLPKYRGPSPISEAILQGDTEAGVSIMKLDIGIDTGAVLLSRSLPVEQTDTTGSLTLKLAQLGADALLEALPGWVAGQIKLEPQDESAASHTRMLKKEDGRVNWNLSAVTLSRQARAYSPWPGLYSSWNGKILKLLQVSAVVEEASQLGEPGSVRLRLSEGKEVLEVVTDDGLLALHEVQLEGKKAMSAAEFLRGYRQIIGQKLV